VSKAFARALTVVVGALWAFLSVLNLIRLHRGWFHLDHIWLLDTLTIAAGLIPLIGLLTAFVQWRWLGQRRTRLVLIMAAVSLFVATLYVYGAFTGVADVGTMYQIVR
jgi:hypothetical protein